MFLGKSSAAVPSNCCRGASVVTISDSLRRLRRHVETVAGQRPVRGKVLDATKAKNAAPHAPNSIEIRPARDRSGVFWTQVRCVNTMKLSYRDRKVRIPVVERAYELAQTGAFSKVSEISG